MRNSFRDKRFSGIPNRIPAPVLALAGILLFFLPLAGCVSGGEKTVTVERTVTVTPDGASTREEIDGYKSAIDGMSGEADAINREFRDRVDRFNRGESDAEEIAGLASSNRQRYEDMTGRLTEMRVPPEFRDAHRELISGFSKWRSAFESYRDGFREGNNILLDRAREEDNQAVVEVNQAINSILQVE
ncbi:MAG: hypothetical protein IBX61_02320 [Thermoleophilia bacterium]|nr:hypothetical protein [Thermoleophilia bacterium]